jgi:hypothetical protein
VSKPLPTNRRSPTNGIGGWFYVNRYSIDVVAQAPIVRLTRTQLLAALKLMSKPA